MFAHLSLYILSYFILGLDECVQQWNMKIVVCAYFMHAFWLCFFRIFFFKAEKTFIATKIHEHVQNG